MTVITINYCFYLCTILIVADKLVKRNEARKKERMLHTVYEECEEETVISSRQTSVCKPTLNEARKKEKTIYTVYEESEDEIIISRQTSVCIL